MGNLLETQFEKMGARVRVRELVRRSPWGRRLLSGDTNIRLDIARDRHGEYFDVQADSDKVRLEVLDLRPRERHLLLMSRDASTGTKEKFLCGHDERSWFVAAVPGKSVSNVNTAFEALKPRMVRAEQDRKGVRGKHRKRRRTAAYVRQGEWFFLPAPEVFPPVTQILQHEPLRRGGGKPHMAEFCVRVGGETVYVCSKHPNGLLESAYRAILEQTPSARLWGWRVMSRDAVVFVRGRIRHPDHKTICLPFWHRVMPNTETEAPAMRHVAFLD